MLIVVGKDMDMTNGKLWNKIIIFALPIALSGMLQQLFHSVDMAVVGKFVGNSELAAVGSNGSIINVLVNFFMGLTVGANVIIAQAIGAGNKELATKSVSTSIFMGAVSGFIIMLLGLFLARPLLELVSSPPDVIDLATVYLRIYFLGAPFIMIYNFGAAIFRSRGQTIKPFYCLVASGIINALLNLLFVLVFDMGVSGVALATALSNGVSCFMVVYMLCHDESEFKLSLKKIKGDIEIIKKILKIGLPMSIQACLFPISNMMVQASINSLGTTVVAACAVSTSIESYSYTLMSGFAQSTITFVSQNYGAGKLQRCRKSFRISLMFNLVITALFSIIMTLILDYALTLFTSDTQIMVIAKERILFMYMTFSIAILMDGFTYALRGLGYSIIPTLVSVVGVCGLRILWLVTIFKKFPTLLTVISVYPVSWAVVALIQGIIYMIIVKKLSKTM